MLRADGGLMSLSLRAEGGRCAVDWLFVCSVSEIALRHISMEAWLFGRELRHISTQARLFVM